MRHTFNNFIKNNNKHIKERLISTNIDQGDIVIEIKSVKNMYEYF